MPVVFDYTTHPTTGTVHVVKVGKDRTACGLRWELNWKDGDETVSGIAATCQACKNAVRRAQHPLPAR